jgi:hypothetical protein
MYWVTNVEYDNNITVLYFYRSKLRYMLQMSSLYRIQLILGKAKETDMHAECAILYGKVITRSS